jgi:hypothetical protein
MSKRSRVRLRAQAESMNSYHSLVVRRRSVPLPNGVCSTPESSHPF